MPFYTKRYDHRPPAEHLPIILRLIEKACFSLGYSINYVSLKNVDAGKGQKGLLGQVYEDHAGGWQIELERTMDDDTTIETLIHELAHGVGDIGYEDYRYETAELLVELVTYDVLGHYNWPTSYTLRKTVEGASPYMLKKYGPLVAATAAIIIDAIDSVY